MQKDDQGVWRVTTDPLNPEYYTYTYNVDGARVNDPTNHELKTSSAMPGEPFRVPGVAPWEPARRPAGPMPHHFDRSKVVGDDRDFYVYTPPRYDPTGKSHYPGALSLPRPSRRRRRLDLRRAGPTSSSQPHRGKEKRSR